jgi:hypothetical protein
VLLFAGIKVLATTVSNVIRLYMFATSDSSPFRMRDMLSYICVLVLSVVGTAVGSRLRDLMDTEAVLRCLYALLILSTASMFGVDENPVQFVIFLACSCAFFAVIWLVYRLPTCEAWQRARFSSLARRREGGSVVYSPL